MKFNSLKLFKNCLFQGFERTAAHQGAYQLYGIGLTLVIAIVSGLVTGKFSKNLFNTKNH